ncbi:MAG: histidine kinase [Negativicutes bacterium]
MAKKIFVRIGYMLIIIAVIAGFVFTVKLNQKPDSVHRGVVEIFPTQLTDEVIDLNGDWEFYPDKLLTPYDIAHQPAQFHYLRVPGSWTGQDADGVKFPYNLYGTYRIVIKTPQSAGQIMGISLGAVRSSNHVYINGVSAGLTGNPGVTPATTVSSVRPSTYLFIARPENEIIIQAANFVNSNRGGIISPIVFGTSTAINGDKISSIVADVILAVLFAVVLAIFAGQYFQRNKEFELLWFSNYCLFSLMMYLTLNHRLIFYLDAELPYENFAMISYNAVNWSIFSLLMYVRVALKIKQKYLISGMTGVMIILTALILFLPLPLFTKYFQYMLLWDLFVGLVIIAFAGYGIVKRTDGYDYLTLCVVCFVMMYLATLLDYMGLLDSVWYIAIVCGMFLIAQLLFINDRYRLTLLKRQREAFELEYLRAQIKPHFIFNALGSIGGLMLEDVGKARKTLSDFSRYLRAMFSKENRRGYVSVEEELQLTEYYLRIEAVRYGERLVVEIDVPETVRQKNIPPLTLQPLAENCVKHGFKSKGDNTVRISIMGMILDKKTLIIVQDNGSGITDNKLREIMSGKSLGIGISNTVARIKHAGGDLRFETTSTGFKAIITLSQ